MFCPLSRTLTQGETFTCRQNARKKNFLHKIHTFSTLCYTDMTTHFQWTRLCYELELRCTHGDPVTVHFFKSSCFDGFWAEVSRAAGRWRSQPLRRTQIFLVICYSVIDLLEHIEVTKQAHKNMPNEGVCQCGAVEYINITNSTIPFGILSLKTCRLSHFINLC